jgi:transposase
MGGENLQELVKKQAKIISEQAETIKKLEALVRELQETIARLQKDSHNSPKPPSSDMVKPKSTAQKTNSGEKQKIGGQSGHKRHERIPFSPEHVDRFIEVTLPKCPLCGGMLEEDEKKV